MRESLGAGAGAGARGAGLGRGLAALRAHGARRDEGAAELEADAAASDWDEGGGAAEDEVNGVGDDARAPAPEPTWQELLDGDATFSALAATVESLIARGRRAVEYEPARGEAGRVLSTVEMEDRLHEGEGDEEDEDEEEGDGDEDLTPESSGRSTPATATSSSSTGVNVGKGGGGGGMRPSERGLGIVGWQGARR